MNLSTVYPAKLLLFGEYTVLHGSQALAVPLPQWKGQWIHQPDTPHDDIGIQAYIDWLKSQNIISSAIADSIHSDARVGWYYQADIPIGCGLGSSGAYVAAIYDRYITKANTRDHLNSLIALSKMEGFFHGSSSGMDPMVSYTNQALYKDERGTFHSIDDPGWPAAFEVFLLDSGSGRLTAPLVKSYKEKIANNDIKHAIERELIPAVEHAIHFYLSSAPSMLEECLSIISQFQRTHLSMLIPDDVLVQWDTLSKIPGVYVKFCGAGGGGYFLVINASKQPISQDIPLIRIKEIHSSLKQY